MPSLTVALVGTSGVLSLLSGILGVVLTCSQSTDGCGTGGAGAGFAVAILLAVLSILATVVFSRKMSTAIAKVVGVLDSMSELDAEVLIPMDEDDEPPIHDSISEIALLEHSQFQLQRVLGDIVTFLPGSLFRKEGSGDSKGGKDPDSVSGRKGPMDMQSQGTIGKASTHMSSTSTSMMAARVLQLSSSLMHRRVSVLCINIRAFRHGFSEASVIDDVLLALADYIQEVEDVVRQQRGVIDHFHGDNVMVSFNAFTHASQHTRRAVTTALEVIERMKGRSLDESGIGNNGTIDDVGVLDHLDISCGASTGNAFVGNVGSHNVRRPCVIGTVFNQAVVLQRLTKLYFPSPKQRRSTVSPAPNYLTGAASGAASPSGSYNASYLSPKGPNVRRTSSMDVPDDQSGNSNNNSNAIVSAFAPAQQVLVQHHVAMDCDHDFTCQALDVVTLPGMTRHHTIFAVHTNAQFEEFRAAQASQQQKGRRHTVANHEEWMYAVEQQQQGNPFMNLNAGFDELNDGNFPTAKEYLDIHRQKMAELGSEKDDALLGVSLLTGISERNLSTALSSQMGSSGVQGGAGGSSGGATDSSNRSGTPPPTITSPAVGSLGGGASFERDLGMYYNWSVK